jgi:hypothetical protein
MRRIEGAIRGGLCGLLALGSVAGLSLSPPIAIADTGVAGGDSSGPAGPDLTAKLVDAILVRPLGVLSTLAGAGFFVVSLPLVLPSGQLEISREVLIDTPIEDTFRRPLGAL